MVLKNILTGRVFGHANDDELASLHSSMVSIWDLGDDFIVSLLPYQIPVVF